MRTTFIKVKKVNKCDPTWENPPNCPKINLVFFHILRHKCIFSHGIGEKTFGVPHLIIWRVWKWAKNKIFVEVVQRIPKKKMGFTIILERMTKISGHMFHFEDPGKRYLNENPYYQQLSGEKKTEMLLKVM